MWFFLWVFFNNWIYCSRLKTLGFAEFQTKIEIVLSQKKRFYWSGNIFMTSNGILSSSQFCENIFKSKCFEWKLNTQTFSAHSLKVYLHFGLTNKILRIFQYYSDNFHSNQQKKIYWNIPFPIPRNGDWLVNKIIFLEFQSEKYEELNFFPFPE